MKIAALLVALSVLAYPQAKRSPSAVGTAIPGDAKETILLWPNGAPEAIGDTFDDQPKLWCYPASGPGPHTAVVVIPGGGYNHLVTEQEGALEARWLNTLGISAYILQYRLGPRYLYPIPQIDGQRAVRYVRAHAKDWLLNPEAIGVWGFSAGGHLAGFLATAHPRGSPELPLGAVAKNTQNGDTIDHVSARPDFAILSYARVAVTREIPGSWSIPALTGPDPSDELNRDISPVDHVSKSTSPSFIYATEFDEKVNSMNATAFFNALRRAEVPAELHVFERGPHGTHMGTDQPNYPELRVFPLLLENWLHVHNFLAARP